MVLCGCGIYGFPIGVSASSDIASLPPWLPTDDRVCIHRTATSSLYTACYKQLFKRFGCSQEIANLGLSLYVLGTALGPLLFSPFSEVCHTAGCLAIPQSLIPKPVLWTEANIYNLDSLLLDMVDSMRGRAKYADTPGRTISQWCVWKCISCRRWWNYSGLVHPSATAASNDHLCRYCFRWASCRTSHWWLHQLFC